VKYPTPRSNRWLKDGPPNLGPIMLKA
jgi:hypothetical protein